MLDMALMNNEEYAFNFAAFESCVVPKLSSIMLMHRLEKSHFRNLETYASFFPYRFIK